MLELTRTRTAVFNANIWTIARRHGAFVIERTGECAASRTGNCGSTTGCTSTASATSGCPRPLWWPSGCRPATAGTTRCPSYGQVTAGMAGVATRLAGGEHAGPWTGSRLRRTSRAPGRSAKYPRTGRCRPETPTRHNSRPMPADTLRAPRHPRRPAPHRPPAPVRRPDGRQPRGARFADRQPGLGCLDPRSGADPARPGRLPTAAQGAPGGHGVGHQRQDHHDALPGRRGPRRSGSRAATGWCTNADGANLHGGITAALSAKPERTSWAIIETDERVVADMIRLGPARGAGAAELLPRPTRPPPRDQGARPVLARRPGRGRRGRAGGRRQRRRAAGGVGRADRPSGGLGGHRDDLGPDASLCPECGVLLLRTQPGETGGHGGLALLELRTRTAAGDYRRVDGRRSSCCPTAPCWIPELQVPGAFNVVNAACALAAAVELGVASETAACAACARSPRRPDGSPPHDSAAPPPGCCWPRTRPAGRRRCPWLVRPGGAGHRLRRRRRPATCPGCGTSTTSSWPGRTVIATGPRAQDLAVRLAYAEVDHQVIPDLAAAVASVRGGPRPAPARRLRRSTCWPPTHRSRSC